MFKINKPLKSILLNEYFLLTVMLFLGFFVRLYKIDNPIADWHSWRQADTASVTKIYVNQGISLFYPRYHDISSIQTGIYNPNGYRFVEFPIFNALHAFFYKSFSSISLEVWGRLLNAMIAVTTAGFLFLISATISDRRTGLLTAFFYLFIPFNIYFTRVILPDPLGVMFGVVSVWAFLKFVQKNQVYNFYLSAVFMCLALLIKPYLAFFLFPVSYLAVKKFGLEFVGNRPMFRKLCIYLFISFVPFLLWRAWMSQYPEGIPFYKWAFNGDSIRFRPSFWFWIFGERLGHLILGSLGVVPFVFGILNTKVKSFFGHTFLVGALLYLVVVATANVRHDYYQILIIPAVSFVLSSGFTYLWENNVFNKILSRMIAIFSVVVMLITGFLLIKNNYNVNHPEIVEIGARVDAITPKDALVVVPYNGDTAFLYQTNRFGWPAVDDSIDNLIKKGADYYVSVDLASEDTLNFEKKFLTVEKTDVYIILDLHKKI